MRAIAAQFARFGVVGLGGLMVDIAVFNILRATLLSPDDVHEGPVIAKVVSVTLAIVVNWLGNRHWAFRHHTPPASPAGVAREGLAFIVVSLGGMAITLGCLIVSHYLLGFTSIVADNIASNGVGLVLGTAFRFAFYRSWVFAPTKAPAQPPAPVTSRAAESPVRPSGFAPLRRLQTIAPIDNRSTAHE